MASFILFIKRVIFNSRYSCLKWLRNGESRKYYTFFASIEIDRFWWVLKEHDVQDLITSLLNHIIHDHVLGQ